MLRPAAEGDTAHLLELATATGVFQPGEVDELLGSVLSDLHAGRLPEGHQVWVCADGGQGPASGWVYFAPTPKADGVWDLWWIGVDPSRHGRGVGSELLQWVEQRVRQAAGRLLIIETSSTPAFDSVQRWYGKRGYKRCGVIPEFYGPGDGKVIFAKTLA